MVQPILVEVQLAVVESILVVVPSGVVDLEVGPRVASVANVACKGISKGGFPLSNIAYDKHLVVLVSLCIGRYNGRPLVVVVSGDRQKGVRLFLRDPIRDQVQSNRLKVVVTPGSACSNVTTHNLDPNHRLHQLAPESALIPGRKGSPESEYRLVSVVVSANLHQGDRKLLP